ncbi:hypothetical protein C1645_810716 [Glomus cerebriforme]|uniref:Uncharacterized protein n=1 Tax=Glomus cerebriforme TaxID=658196 RepID=A0A397S2D7_9GLOM|nr:hypothetical protein C1645_810716 [Glomus cerebriforme]
MKFTTTKFAITIFMLLAYVAVISQAIGIKNGGGYVAEFQEKHRKLMGDLRNTVDELDHRMETPWVVQSTVMGKVHMYYVIDPPSLKAPFVLFKAYLDYIENLEDIELLDSKHTPLRPGTNIQTLAKTTTDENPLVVRYLISGVNIKVILMNGHKHGNCEIPHTSGSFSLLKDHVKKNFENFENLGEEMIYFVHNGMEIWNAYNFNTVVMSQDVKNAQGVKNILLKLTIKVKGKKIYSKWRLKDAFKEILHRPDYETLEDLPILEMETLLPLDNPYSTSEIEKFVWELQKALDAYNKAINETTCHAYIDAFMTIAVQHVKLYTKKLIRLCNKIGLEGSRGFSPADYVVKLYEILILLCKAKSEDMNQGSAQLLVQMQSAMEQQLRNHKDGRVFGIVTTGKLWRFFLWAGSLEKPMVKISEEYTCNFKDKMEAEKEIIKYIAQMLQAQVKVFSDDVNSNSSRPSKRHCTGLGND